MTQKQARALDPGVYRLALRRSGDLLAIVGVGMQGQWWYATTTGNLTWDYEPGPRGGADRRRYKVGRTDWGRFVTATPVICVDATP